MSSSSDLILGGFCTVWRGWGIFLSEGTPAYLAKNLITRLKKYADTLYTPLFIFGALVDYAEKGNQAKVIANLHVRHD